MGGYATSWKDIVCIKCDSSYEIKSKASTEKIEKAIKYNNIQGGSFKRFHRLRREKEGNKDAKHYLVLVSRAPTEIICASATYPRTAWQVDLAEIDTVLPALRDVSFTRPAGDIVMKASIKVKEGTRKVWFRIPFVEIDQRGIAREVFDEYYETKTKTVKIEKLHAKMGDKPEGEDVEPVPSTAVRSSTPTVKIVKGVLRPNPIVDDPATAPAPIVVETTTPAPIVVKTLAPVPRIVVETPAPRCRLLYKNLIDLRKNGWVARREEETAIVVKTPAPVPIVVKNPAPVPIVVKTPAPVPALRPGGGLRPGESLRPGGLRPGRLRPGGASPMRSSSVQQQTKATTQAPITSSGGRGGRGQRNSGYSEDLLDGLAPILNKSGNPAYVPSVGRYVAPGARKEGMSLGGRMRKERETVTMGATKVIPKGIADAFAGKKLPGGMAPADQGKSKNALQKERHPTLSLGQRLLAKEKQEQVVEEERQRNEQKEKLKLDNGGGRGGGQLGKNKLSNQKRRQHKELNKILRQILELKKKDPACVNEAQMKKVAREVEVLKQLAKLNSIL
eukprot:scaffold5740_cov165-Chaetoceros_neogracile.AAC.1